MAYPGVFNFPPLVKGDTFLRMSFTFNFSLVGFKADMWIVDGFTEDPIKKMSTTEGSLTIDEELDKIFIEKFDIEMQPGTHKYDLQLIAPDGTKTTFITGYFPVNDDITKV